MNGGFIPTAERHATEDEQARWLEAPNPFVADWVKAHLPPIEQALRPYTALPTHGGIH